MSHEDGRALGIQAVALAADGMETCSAGMVRLLSSEEHKHRNATANKSMSANRRPIYADSSGGACVNQVRSEVLMPARDVNNPENHRVSHDTQWSDLDRAFRELQGVISGVQFPSVDEIDCFKASLAAPRRVTSPLAEQFSWGARYPKVMSKERTWFMVQALGLLGRGRDPIPRHLRNRIRDHVQIVQDGLATHSLSLEFVLSWGEINKALGAILTLLNDESSDLRSFYRQMNAAIMRDEPDKATKAKKVELILQKYWYAHWLGQNGVLHREQPRSDIDSELLLLCEDIIIGRRKARQYALTWFAAMLAVDDDRQLRLKATFTRLPLKEITRMVNNKLIPLSALPPLSSEDFPAPRT